MNKILAVYGTLRSGYGNNSYCLRNSRSLGVGYVSGMKMYSNGYFPICTRSGSVADRVVVELFSVVEGDLAKCDRLEGHPSFYQRETVEVLKEDGQVIEADMYLQGLGDCSHLTFVATGDWANRGDEYGM